MIRVVIRGNNTSNANSVKETVQQLTKLAFSTNMKTFLRQPLVKQGELQGPERLLQRYDQNNKKKKKKKCLMI